MDFRDLPPSAKLVLGYLLIEHVINGRDWVTVSDIVFNVGITERRLRSVMKMLREEGFVEAYIDPAAGKRHLYRLSFARLELERPEIPPGLYMVDVDSGISIPWDLTFRTYAIIRTSSMLLYTASLRRLTKLLELTRCTCLTLDLGAVADPEAAARQAAQAAAGGRVVAVLYDSAQDGEAARAIAARAREAGVNVIQVANRRRHGHPVTA